MRVRSGFLRLSFWTLLACLFACGNEAAFIPFSQLCPALAEDVCNARNGGCCTTMVDQLRCEESETALCEADKVTLENEASRGYDSRAAARQEQAVRALLDACGGTPSLATYFTDGLPLGSACERPSQCASGACTGTPAVCIELAPRTLCLP